jgi:site-specific DNA-methyltransferase (adenine-specific)
MTTLINADCLHALKTIQTHSIDLVLADPPFGTTTCSWDTPIPLAPLWRELTRVIRPNGAIVLFAAQPFTTALIVSNLAMFKYCWVWEKNQPSGFAQAKNKPLSRHEDICVFSTGVTVHQGQSARRMPYFP